MQGLLDKPRSMPVFSIQSECEFLKKPLWFDDFRKRYDEPSSPHITLKTNTFCKDADTSALLDIGREIAQEQTIFTVLFNHFSSGRTKRGFLFFLCSDHDGELRGLQKTLVRSFSRFGENTQQEYAFFERNFKPHITIARHLLPSQHQSAGIELLNGDVSCIVRLSSFTITIMKKESFECWNDSKNRTRCPFKLSMAHYI